MVRSASSVMMLRIGGIHRLTSSLSIDSPSQVQVGRPCSFDRSGSGMSSPRYVATCSSVNRAHMSWPSLVYTGEEDAEPVVGDPWLSRSFELHPVVRSKTHPTNSSRRCPQRSAVFMVYLRFRVCPGT